MLFQNADFGAARLLRSEHTGCAHDNQKSGTGVAGNYDLYIAGQGGKQTGIRFWQIVIASTGANILSRLLGRTDDPEGDGLLILIIE